MNVKLIAHSLIKQEGLYLFIKRSQIKRKQLNVYPLYWDIPGGSVDAGELPRDAAVRECLEEVGLEIQLGDIIHEDSQYDDAKGTIFTRLVYRANLREYPHHIVLDPEEHLSYRWVKDPSDLAGEQIVPYLIEILEKEHQKPC